MAIIPSDIQKILEEETDLESPLSEQLLNKIGGTLNALVDLLANVVEFNSGGVFNVPENVQKIYVLGAGGGGGGSGGQLSGTAKGQRGGCGSVPKLMGIRVTPLQALTITIGAGGSGGSSGNAGGNGGFSRISGSNVNMYFLGAIGGGVPTGGPTPTEKGLAPEPANYTAGSEDSTVASRNGNTSTDGQDSVYASGGNGNQGGGGGAGFGNGAAGATGLGTNGFSANANSSAGGGGAGGNIGTTGGNGGSGKIIIFY